MDISSNSENKILNSIMSISCSITSSMQSINMQSSDHLVHSHGSSYTVNMAHVTYWCWQAILDSIGSHIDGGASSGLADADIHMLDYTK